jgi:hypothetical protein
MTTNLTHLLSNDTDPNGLNSFTRHPLAPVNIHILRLRIDTSE